MKDLQAMDRAHRIGQKKVVNVYRFVYLLLSLVFFYLKPVAQLFSHVSLSSSFLSACRLITSGTLEEKIMSLQKFKLSIANTVISAENSSLTTMGTDQLLNLFSLEKVSNKDDSSSSNKLTTTTGKGIKSVLESLPELCDESSYETEYDLSNFIQSLH